MTTPVCHAPRLLAQNSEELVILVAPTVDQPASIQTMWWSVRVPALHAWLTTSPLDWTQFPGPITVSRIDGQLLIGALVSSQERHQTVAICANCRVTEDSLLQILRTAVAPALPPPVTQIDRIQDRVYLSGEAGTLCCRYLPGRPPFQFAEHRVTPTVEGDRLGHLVSADPPSLVADRGPCPRALSYYLTHDQALQIWPPGEGCEC